MDDTIVTAVLDGEEASACDSENTENNSYNQFDPIPHTPDNNSPKKKRNHHGAGIIAVALVCSLLGGMGGAGLTYKLLDASSKNTSTTYQGKRELSEVKVINVDTNAVLTDAEIYSANVASTVGIKSAINTTNIWGFNTTAAASGSGFVYSSDGYIVTNYHVVEGSTAITVTDHDGAEHEAQLIGYDESNDVAVLKIENNTLAPVIIGNSDSLIIGDHVVAIGNPLGELTFSLTQGAVSSLNRDVTFSAGMSMRLIQTDCAINSGNSGGALFNNHGEVIGITNAKYSSSSGRASVDNIGFAIPINSVKPIIDSIIERGYVAKPYIGVTVSSVSAEAQTFGLPAGAAIQEVVEGSPAFDAGLSKNDIVTAIDGVTITSSNDLIAEVSGREIGQSISLTVYRSGEVITVDITIGERQQPSIAG